MIVTLQNWTQLNICGIMVGGSQRDTAVDHVRQRRMDMSMEPQD